MSLMEALVQLERSLDELARRWDLYLAHEPGAAMPGAGEVDALARRIREAGAGRSAVGGRARPTRAAGRTVQRQAIDFYTDKKVIISRWHSAFGGVAKTLDDGFAMKYAKK